MTEWYARYSGRYLGRHHDSERFIACLAAKVQGSCGNAGMG
jgi:hypothetical protein